MNATASNTLTAPAPVWFARADLPNSHGFRFAGLMAGNAEELCTVSRRADGSHTLANNAFPRLLKWRNLNAGDTRRPLLQARFEANGQTVASFALLNERGEARAVISTYGEKITRANMGQRTSGPDASAFRAYVSAVLAGEAERSGVLEFGPELPAGEGAQ